MYRNELLPVSETFIKEQILALEDWRAVLVGRKRLNELPLDDLNVRIVGAASPAFSSRVSWKAHRLLRSIPSHIKRSLEAEAPCLVHAHFGPDALDAWPLARALNLPMLVTLHGYDINTYRDWWEAGKGGPTMRTYPRRLLKLVEQPRVGFIAVSQAIRQRAIEFGIPGEKITVNYIGIDTSKFAPGSIPIAQRPAHVLFVGRLVEKKGCRYLIEAMSAVQKDVPDARLIVVGDGPLRHSLEQLAQRSGVNVDFRGAQSSAYVKRELNAARVFCLPSVTAESGDAEGFGLVLLEAQASGVPVVTSARGGAAEGIREGVTGYRFAEGDIEILATKLISLLKENKILRQMSEQGSRYVAQEFDLTHRARQLEILYDAAVLPR
ncbi:glycosyltransferase [Bradyrhizobium sp. AZCC 2289]|uniref:glycosyltransferase n=1 Tax=Bradyrhizobium sp. AZCC 2289 TaxID=3117026 RepID=UPI002FF0F32A